MTNKDSDKNREEARDPNRPPMAEEVALWFMGEVLPLEPLLMHFLRRNWRNQSEIADLRQEVYVRVWIAAHKALPAHAKRFVLITARNLVINKLRDAQVVPIELIADVDALGATTDLPDADRALIARDELRRLQDAIDQLHPRCREAIMLAHVEGLAGHEIAQRMSISRAAVSIHLARGLQLLTDIMYGEHVAREKKT
jgi:RNA polymerase sigma-70 factor (ECF subfamily)